MEIKALSFISSTDTCKYDCHHYRLSLLITNLCVIYDVYSFYVILICFLCTCRNSPEFNHGSYAAFLEVGEKAIKSVK